MDKEWASILYNIKKWVKEAGEEQKLRFKSPMKIQRKSADIDLVTEVDVWSEDFLINKIRSHYPTHHVLTEESGRHIGEAEYEWVIDPIDGTTNFAHGFPLFCISIGVKHKGQTVLGVVYLPILDELYEAVLGSGAFLNGKEIRTSSVKTLPEAIIATGFPYDRATDVHNNVDNFSAVVTKVAGIRRTGSAAIDLCQVAAGHFDGYWELKLKPWDVEAGLLLVKEAGGFIQRRDEQKGIFIIVGNKDIFQELQGLVKGSE